MESTAPNKTHIRIYTWSDPRVIIWEKEALKANRSAIEIDWNLFILWLPSRNDLSKGEFSETEVATAVIQWAQKIESVRSSSVYIQCKNKEVESILSKSPEEQAITIYDIDYKK